MKFIHNKSFAAWVALFTSLSACNGLSNSASSPSPATNSASSESANKIGAGVNVVSPASGTVGSPFTLQANASSCQGQTIASMGYSLDSASQNTVFTGGSINTSVSAAVGAHTLHVKSWGAQGAGCLADVAITVVAGGVTVTQPAQNATVSSPFTLKAQSTTCNGQTVASMAYSIGNGANSTAVYSTSLSTSVTASAGQQQTLHVKSWGNKGAGCVADIVINVTAASGFEGSAHIPQPPASATRTAYIQELNGWAGKTGAASSCPDGVVSSTCNPPNANFNANVTHTADPLALTGSDGSTGLFAFYQGPAWATAIWGHSLLTQAAARNFIWDFYLYVDNANYYSSELDLYTSLNNGQRFMMGTQCNRIANSWDTWSEANQKWIQNTSVPCNAVLTPGKWHRITFYNTVNASSNTYTYQTLRIDGVDYVLNQPQSTKDVNWPDGLIGVQVQLDANVTGAGVNEYIENMQLYSW